MDWWVYGGVYVDEREVGGMRRWMGVWVGGCMRGGVDGCEGGWVLRWMDGLECW